jgi:aminopeptidase N
LSHSFAETAKKLLFDEKTSSEALKQDIADNISHELAHQWFGNLVTMDWWDELWLNESFATWAGHYALDHLFPEWDMWARFAVDRMEDAFEADGLRSSHAVHIPMGSGLQDHQIFDQISYGKGCAILRMLAEYVGVETFLKGVSRYLKVHAYGNATAHALWGSLEEASGKAIIDMSESWVNTVGYPVVTVTEMPDKGQILLRQSRFLTSGDVKPEDDTALWRIPLGITGLDCGQDAFLSEKEQSISGIDLESYSLNARGTGFYRVAYPPYRLAQLSTQLDRFSASDKCSMVASAAALASAGSGSAASLLSFLQAFRRENHAVVWQQVLGALYNIEMAFSEDAEMRAGLKRFTLQLIQDKVNDVGMEPLREENFLTKSLRQTLLAKAVKCGHAGYGIHLDAVIDPLVLTECVGL